MRTAIVLQAVVLYLLFEADTHSVLADTGARGAPLRQAVIIAACSTVESLRLLKTRHKPPVRVRGTLTSNRHALCAALSRQSLANPCVLDSRLKFCHAGPDMCRARSGTDDWLARHF